MKGMSSDVDAPFRVLGVAFVIDQKGSGAKLIMRYPAQPPDGPMSRRCSRRNRPQHEHHHHHQEQEHASSTDKNDDNLFFNLKASQMAKLFRAKKSLCGNPMTLTVNGTVFCCRAVLMRGDEGNEEISNGGTNAATGNSSSSSTVGADPSTSQQQQQQSDQLILFSVIVAISAPLSHSSVRFSFGSWLDTATEDQLDIQRYFKERRATATSPRGATNPERAGKNDQGSVSAAFLAIRRIHVSLARYCRVLEREERRCNFISLQANQFSQIRNEHQKKWEERKAAELTGKLSKQGVSSTGSGSGMAPKPSQSSAERRPRKKRNQSFCASAPGGDELHIQAHQHDLTIEEEQLKEQEIVELMLASAATEPPSANIPRHHGNLARELVQFFHALSRNDSLYPSTPASLLIKRDGIVYVNQHIAIPVEAASPKTSSVVGSPEVRPYYTLLFPHASPSDLLHAMQCSGSTPPQRLQQLLLTVNAQKPLTEIAVDANLPLYTTLEMASYLVTHGACVMSPVVCRQSRLACYQVEKISDLGLEFSQVFGSAHIFRVVGFLTSCKTLGQAMSMLTDSTNEETKWLQEAIIPSDASLKVMIEEVTKMNLVHPSGGGQPQEVPKSHWKEELEEQLYAMAVWLISHQVLAQLQEYFVVVGTEHEDLAVVSDRDSLPAVASTAGANHGQSEADETLFRELLESDFLNGDISVMALAWRLGLDQQRIHAWGLRHRRIRVITRIARPGDDWE